MAKKKKWHDILHAEFDGLPVAPEIYAAIDELREWQKSFAAANIDTTTTFHYVTNVLANAIWKDVGNVIAKIDGHPKIPKVVKYDNEGEKINVSLNFVTLPIFFKLQHVPSKVSAMAAALSKCFVDRCKLVRMRFMWKPDDWWLRLAMNNVTKDFVNNITDNKADVF